jgi:hypothetical protein
MDEKQGVGALSLRPILNDERVGIYQDKNNHLHVYFCGFYRCVLSYGFFKDAEVSFFETDDFLEIRSAGQGIMRFPIPHTLTIEDVEDEWPDVIGGDDGERTNSTSGGVVRT